MPLQNTQLFFSKAVGICILALFVTLLTFIPTADAATQNITGYLDGLQPQKPQLYGWVADTNNQSKALKVEISYGSTNTYTNVTIATTTTANLSSPDVVTVAGIAGKHRFLWNIPKTFAGTSHYWFAHAIKDDGTKVPLLTSPKKISLPATIFPETPLLPIDTKTKTFIEETYKLILGRTPETSGLNVWSQPLIKKEATGVLTIWRIFSSLESRKKAFPNTETTLNTISNEEYVELLYKTVLKRASDPEGKKQHVASLVAGTKRQALFEVFVFSVESKTKNKVLFDTGLLKVRTVFPPVPPSTRVARTAFITALYQCVLKRNPDIQGLQAWLAIPEGASLETLYTRMYESPEYKKTAKESEFIDSAYSCIQGASITETERTKLTKLTTQGWTRIGIINQIVSDPTFQTIRGKKLATETGYSVVPTYPNNKAWPAWRDLVKPFTAGIRSTDVYEGTPANCANVSVYAGTPLLGDFMVSRQTQNGCDQAKWKLVGVQPTWTDNSVTFTKVNEVFNPGVSTVIGDGSTITSAYDPTAMDFAGETWIAFECAGPVIGVSACMGPLTKNKVLDIARTSVIIDASDTFANDGIYRHSASVPKLLNFKNKQYLYWTDVRRRIGVQWTTDYANAGTYLNTRGIGISYDASSKRFYPVDSTSKLIKGRFTANDSKTVIVADRDLTDPRSNRLADVGGVTTDGTYIYAVTALGGGDCLTPLSKPEGCYRNTISRTTNPLSYNTFKTNLIPESYMPTIYQAYPRFVYRADTKSTWMIGGQFTNPRKLPGQPVGKWAFPWPENIMKP
jgi:hypothetical protein